MGTEWNHFQSTLNEKNGCKIENDTIKEYKHIPTLKGLEALGKSTRETRSSGYLSEGEVGEFYTMCQNYFLTNYFLITLHGTKQELHKSLLTDFFFQVSIGDMKKSKTFHSVHLLLRKAGCFIYRLGSGKD